MQSKRSLCDSSSRDQPIIATKGTTAMREKRMVLYKKGIFVCPKCRQSYVQEKWIEEWRIRCHKCDYRGALTEVSVEEHMDKETARH